MTAKNIVIIGQSNERGFATNNLASPNDIGLPRKAERGCPVGDPMAPFNASATSGFYGSSWPKLAEKLYDRSGDWIQIRNNAIATTSLAANWCGTDAGGSAGNVFVEGDVGFDPNSYLSNALAQALAGEYDERWVFIIVTGQRDSSIGTTAANVQASLESAANYFLASGVSVALGMTCAVLTQETWYTDNGQTGLDSALSTFSGNTNVITGGNMWEKLGLNVELLPDGAHMLNRGFEIMTDEWYDKLIAAGW